MNHAIIMAAGRSTRFKSDTPKVLHLLLGRPLLSYVLDTVAQMSCDTTVVVVSAGGETIADWISKNAPSVHVGIQQHPLGTGDAVAAGLRVLSKSANDDWIFVLSGDVPLIRAETLRALRERAESASAAVAVLTIELENPAGYGRIIKQDKGAHIRAIVEERDCSQGQKKLKEINTGIYCFHKGFLAQWLPHLGTDNAQKEMHLTQLIDCSWKNQPHGVPSGAVSFLTGNIMQGKGINDRAQLAELTKEEQTKILSDWMKSGVTFEMPHTVWIERSVKLEQDVVIGPGVKLLGKTVIRQGARVEGNSYIRDSEIGRAAEIRWGSVIEESTLADRVVAGPYARIRPGCALAEEVHIGNFVELKKATLRKKSKAAHLSYIGDATVGERVNIGCGFITCNYDGVAKHQTIIEDDAFIGSDSQTVAPVRIGKGAYVATNTTVTDDVPSEALVISRGRQVVKPSYAKKLLTKKS